MLQQIVGCGTFICRRPPFSPVDFRMEKICKSKVNFIQIDILCRHTECSTFVMLLLNIYIQHRENISLYPLNLLSRPDFIFLHVTYWMRTHSVATSRPVGVQIYTFVREIFSQKIKLIRSNGDVILGYILFLLR